MRLGLPGWHPWASAAWVSARYWLSRNRAIPRTRRSNSAWSGPAWTPTGQAGIRRDLPGRCYLSDGGPPLGGQVDGAAAAQRTCARNGGSPAPWAGEPGSPSRPRYSSSSPQPAYLQAAEFLAARIEAGEFTDRLPGERELTRQFGIAYGTLRRAMEVLRERGLIITRQGRGTFVAAASLG